MNSPFKKSWTIPIASFLLFSTLFFSSCSSLPKGSPQEGINTQKEKAALYLKKGNALFNWNLFESSAEMYAEAFKMAAKVDWLEGMIRSQVHLSSTHDRMGQAEPSRLALDRARNILDHMPAKTPVLTLLVLNRECEWLLFNKNPDSALAFSAHVTEQELKLKVQETGEFWRIRGVALKQKQNFLLAESALKKALALDLKMNFTPEAASDYYILSSILSLKGQKEEALKTMHKALEKDKLIENSPGIAQDLYALALIHEKAGNPLEADHYYQRSLLVYKASGQKIPSSKIEKMGNRGEKNDLWAVHEEDTP